MFKELRFINADIYSYAFINDIPNIFIYHIWSTHIKNNAILISLQDKLFGYNLFKPYNEQHKLSETKTYENGRFDYKINFPKEWIFLKHSTNNDGITLYEHNENSIYVYGSHEVIPFEKSLKLGISEIYKLENFITDSGEKGKLLIGKTADDNKHVFKMSFVKNGIIYTISCYSTKDFYLENEELLKKMAKSLSVLD